MAADTIACQPDGAVKTSFCTPDVHDLLLTHFDASTSSRGDLWKLSSADSLSSLKAASGTTAFIALFNFMQGSDFDEKTL